VFCARFCQGGGPGRGYGGRSSPPDDGLYIPNEVFSTLTSTQRAMIFRGRDEMRKRMGDNQSSGTNQRSTKRVQVEDNNGQTNVATDNEFSDITYDANISSASDSFGHRSLNNKSRKQGGFKSSSRRLVARTYKQVNRTVDYTGRYRLEVNSRADTTCCGRGFIPISEVDQVCDVAGFHPNMPINIRKFLVCNEKLSTFKAPRGLSK
jgi:hypothetical protein